MASRAKGKKHFETCTEKSSGVAYLLAAGGSMGVIVSFFTLLQLGNYLELSLDNVVFAMVMLVFLGFGVGSFITWILIRFFGGIILFSGFGVNGVEGKDFKPEDIKHDPGVGAEEKGKTINYVFPEFSPEKQ